MIATSDLSIDFSTLLENGPLEIKPRRLTEIQFLDFAFQHPNLRIEQEKNGKIFIMSPVGFNSGFREGHPFGAIYAWWLGHRNGRVLSPSTMFKLPDGSKKMADAAWVSEEKYQAMPKIERNKVALVVPDFVVEVRSETDSLEKLKKKMTDGWIANGVRLAWLIDPIGKKAYVYKPNFPVQIIDDFSKTLSGEDVCPGLIFELNLMEI